MTPLVTESDSVHPSGNEDAPSARVKVSLSVSSSRSARMRKDAVFSPRGMVSVLAALFQRAGKTAVIS